MINSKKLLTLALVGSVSMIAACAKVPAGHKGIKVHLLGSAKGVDHEELPVGRYFIGVNEELFIFPTFTQNYVWTKDPSEGSANDESISFQTKEGLSVNADVGISYNIDPDKVSTVFERYRRGVDEITDVFLRNAVRDAFVIVASSKPISSVYGEGKAEIIREVEEIVRNQVGPIGINMERIYWAGELRLPQNVVASLNAKIEATQRAQQRQNEVEEARAEAQKQLEIANGQAQAIIAVAEAKAEANRLLSESMSDAIIQYEWISQWDGKMPTAMFSDNSPIPMMNMASQINQ